MKKITCSCVACFLLVNAVSAQKISTFLTLYGGFAAAQAKDAKLSSGIGLDFQFKLTEKLHFNLKPTFNARGYNGTALVSTVKATYVDLPLNIEADLDANKARLFIGGGPYIGFAIGGKYKSNLTTGNTAWTTMKFGESVTDNRSPVDAGFNLNVGALIEGYSRDFKAGIQTMVGVRDVTPKDAQDLPNASPIRLRNISAYLAFGLTKRK
jgi:Outer membrane protein beta-barrel domain